VAFKRGTGVAVCLLDVDGFSAVTDRLGHQVGGRLLRVLADMLRKQAGSRNVVSRLRGDEFAVILPGAKPGAGRRFADRYLASLSAARFAFSGEKVTLHASVGVVESDASLTSPGEMMRAADAARRVAKASGGSCVRIHEGESS
jgi:diguanylate cyclase (GGDEF)-like protein